jgi:ABC-type nitrate/sulfonate/bicarbonate transport system permease component
MRDAALRAAAAGAGLAGLALVAWWLAVALDVLPEDLAPGRADAWHVAVELFAAGLLLAGAVATFLRPAWAAGLLAAGFAALVYAALNAVPDFDGRPTVQLVLVLTGLFGLGGLALELHAAGTAPRR